MKVSFPTELRHSTVYTTAVYSAREEVEHADWLDELDDIAASLEIGADARSYARDLFLSAVPEQDRSKRARLAASLYAGALIAGEERAQTVVADAVGVSRHTIQSRWKELLSAAGFDTPGW
jgi:transcription initiation factor TFIIIB Brf1 subunit/transcription initiation factor TFIIB